jgi:demethylmenaquinone methyltransferase/2-methoxy-6-polyprenyl-1,4-benzoquinol methylase
MTDPESTESPAPLPPHPRLGRYYRDEDERRGFVRDIFDETAEDYDKVERMMALGSGSWYRRRALVRSGLAVGMRVLDVACGTGLVTREELAVVGAGGAVVGLDPSAGMLSQARRSLPITAVMGLGESLPVREGSVAFLSMGYALRHLSDLVAAFREFHRVLRPGGTVCILELTPPRHPVTRSLLRLYVRGVIPVLARFTARHGETSLLWRYFWDTMDACVPPDVVMEALRSAGFEDVRRFVEIKLFSEYTGRKPD